ncbi:hypothetical protein HMPREF0972_00166 [Actinomyces sp. oral taxon 848 str. F0332]|nr:hypothetical protein HMPREF0972_00166 [Actinomyces sp. oral taxon 848 str. F0332]
MFSMNTSLRRAFARQALSASHRSTEGAASSRVRPRPCFYARQSQKVAHDTCHRQLVTADGFARISSSRK